MWNNAGLHEDVFICLDVFHSIVHNITKSSTLQDAWLTFLDSEDINEISELVRNFPMFLPIYKEIAEFAQRPEELINMFSEALSIMDRNMERLMVEEMCEKLEKTIASSQAELEAARDMAKIEIDAVKAKVESAKAEAETARTEAEIFRQCLAGSSPHEIADSLSITLDKVNNVLSSISK
ncbi:MAG: hypothetical protein HDR12_16595 [Lachnospiraceae bacterium]|nr:hypothetical protein [Lachnospiraceae bacterium]